MKHSFDLKAIGSRKDLKQQLYYQFVEDLLSLDEIQELRQFRHHVTTNRFQHCLNVSYYNYKLCKLFRLDARSAARAGLMHDLYFYETKAYTCSRPPLKHSKYHPMAALDNARKLVSVNDREQDMICNHMWPVTLDRPRYAETYMITIVDKYCAILELLLPQPKRLITWMRKKRQLKRECLQ